MSSSSPKNAPNNMLLLHSPHLPLSHGYGYNHHNAIRTPPRNASPKLSSISISNSSNISPSTSTLIIDSNGEMHDPGYLNSLRSVHAEIGANASQANRRTSNGNYGGHVPSRPSQLGLGLSNYDDARYGSVASSDSEDDDAEEDRLRSMRRNNSNEGSLYQRYFNGDRSNSVSSGTDAFGRLALPNSPSPRHFSFSTNTETAIGSSSNEKNNRKPSRTGRRSSSVTRSPTFRLAALQSSQQEADKKSENSWGFTGIVDVEREQRVAREAMEARTRTSQDGVDSESNQATTPPSSRRPSRSLFRKSSNSSSLGQGGDKEAKSLGSTGTSSPSFWSFSSGKGSTMQRHSSLSSLQQYNIMSNEKNGLRTIMSGKPLKDDDSSLNQWAPTLEPAFDCIRPGNLMDSRLEEQQREADFIMGPSKYKQSKELFKKKSRAMSDAPTQAQDLKTKVESIASNVRFGAFKAKKRIERSFNSDS